MLERVDVASRVIVPEAPNRWTAGSVSYTVNANLTNRGSDVFAYEQANCLTSATASGVSSTNTYDGDGKRASQTVGSITTSYIYDINNSLPDGTFKYVYGLGLAYAVDTSGNVQVYHTDGLGSVRAITDANGNLIETYQTDEFGMPTQTQGTSTQPFGYTGPGLETWAVAAAQKVGGHRQHQPRCP